MSLSEFSLASFPSYVTSITGLLAPFRRRLWHGSPFLDLKAPLDWHEEALDEPEIASCHTSDRGNRLHVVLKSIFSSTP
jgi:hypothetical protein